MPAMKLTTTPVLPICRPKPCVSVQPSTGWASERKKVMARLIHAARSDQQCGRHDVSELMDKLRVEGLHAQDDHWLDRITEGLDALYPRN